MRTGVGIALTMLRVVVALGATALTLVAIAVAAILYHPAGSRLAYDLARPRLPGGLRLDAIEGPLAGPLRIGALEWRSQTLGLRIADLTLDWRWVQGRLALALSADTVDIATSTGAAPVRRPDAALAAFALPLPVQLTRLEVQSLRMNGGLDLSVRAAATMVASRLRLDALHVRGGGHGFDASGWIDTRGDYPLALDGRETLTLAQQKTLQGATRIRGALLQQLQWQQEFSGAATAAIEGTAEDVLNALRWRANGRIEPLTLAAIGISTGASLATARLHGSFDATGERGIQRLSARFIAEDLPWPTAIDRGAGAGEIEARVDAELIGRTLTLRQVQLAHKRTQTRVSASGSYELDSQRLALALAWDSRAPVSGAASAIASSGRINASGVPNAYRFEGEGEVSAPGYPVAHFEVAGNGHRAGLTLSTGRVVAAKSRIDIGGDATWAPGVTAHADVELTDVDPGMLRPDWPGRLSGHLRIDGARAATGFEGTLALRRLRGQLRGFPVSARGTLRADGQNLTLDAAEWRSGGSRLTATGTLAGQWSLCAAIASGNLAELLPGAGGRLRGDLRLTGPRRHPLVALTLAGDQLHFGGYRTDRLRVQARLDTGPQGALRATAEAIAAGATDAEPWQRVAARLDGSRESHRLRLRASREGLVVTSAASGGLDQDSLWRGRLERLRIDSTSLGRWQLRDPSAVIAGPTRVEIMPFCIERSAGTAASVCGRSLWRDHEWQAQATLSALPLALVRNLLPARLAVSGELSGQLAARGSTGADVTGSAWLRTSGGVIAVDATGFRFAPSTASFTLDPGGLRGQLDWRFVDAGAIRGDILWPGWRSQDGYPRLQPVTGAIHLRTTALPLATLASTELANLRGEIAVDLDLGGTLGAPQFSGRATLADAGADLPAVGVQITDAHLELVAAPDRRIDLQGALHAGSGALRVRGTATADPDAGWPLRLTIAGENLPLIDTRDANVIASPALELTAARGRIAVDGDIRIPRARLTPRKLPAGAVKASTDVVLVAADGTAASAPTEGFPVHSRVRVALGDDVRIDGLGLRGRLDGELLVSTAPDAPTRGSGTIRIHEGFYETYGQRLRIDDGQLLFAGALDNPGLDLRATRTTGAITAGVHATGTAREPQVKLFSTPAMAESDALAYLLLGRPLNQASGSDGGMLMAAASGMGLGKGEDLAQSIGRSLGLDEVRVDSSADTGATSLIVGRRLAPNLYLRYLAGLFGAPGSVQLRYQLRPHIELQSETGAGAGADIFYTIEH